MNESGASNGAYSYVDAIIEPDFGTHKELGRTLPPSVVTDTSYVLDLPAQSTLLLEITHNFRSKHYGSVSVSEKELLNEDGSYLKEFSKKRSGPSKYTIWYDILN